MKTSADLAQIAAMTALLIGGQLALSAVVGVEIVTVLLCSYCCAFGAKRGAIVSIAFCLLRTAIFGFFPSAFLLYIIYYPLFALVVGLLSKKLFSAQDGNVNEKAKSRRAKVCSFALLIVAVCALTACFTLIDDVITPLMLGLSKGGAQKYFIASLPIMLVQVVCAFVSVLFLFPILFKTFLAVKRKIIIS